MKKNNFICGFAFVFITVSAHANMGGSVPPPPPLAPVVEAPTLTAPQILADESQSIDLSDLAKNIPALVAVNPNLIRGGRPNDEGIRGLAQRGVKTIINLEDTDSAIRHEKEVAAAAGIPNYYSLQFTAVIYPKKEKIDKVLKLLSNPDNYPIYIHCYHGQDRTGLMVAIHRMKSEGLSKAAAYADMMKNGFHKAMWGSWKYFDDDLYIANLETDVSSVPEITLNDFSYRNFTPANSEISTASSAPATDIPESLQPENPEQSESSDSVPQ